MEEKKDSTNTVLLVIIIIILIAGGAFWWYRNFGVVESIGDENKPGVDVGINLPGGANRGEPPAQNPTPNPSPANY